MQNKKFLKDFGVKEKVLNFTSNAYQLTRPYKVGTVMALIRKCQPKSFDEWEKWYFENAFTETAKPIKVTTKVLDELGERLYVKLKEIIIPEWTEAFHQITLNDCKEYIYNLTINRTFDGYLNEKSIVTKKLSKEFPDIVFEESDPELDHAGDIDYLGWIGDKAFGIQIKPVTAQANFGNYSVSERMNESFDNFKSKYGGKVFLIFSIDEKISNNEIVMKLK